MSILVLCLQFSSGEYQTELNFRFKFVGSELANGETDFEKLEDTLTDNCHGFAEQIVLTVDGVEYTVGNGNVTSIWYDAQGGASTENYCYVTAYLPAAGMRDAAAATLTIGDIACTLK